MNKRYQIFLYAIADYISAGLGWFLFFEYRKNFTEAAKHGYNIPINGDIKLLIGVLLFPIFWLLLYLLQGFYKDIFRRSRFTDISQTLGSCALGTLILFFTLVLDDSVSNYKDYYFSLIVLFLCHTIPTVFFRVLITTRTIYNVQSRKWGYNTLLIGAGKRMRNLVAELNTAQKSEGFYLKGFISLRKSDPMGPFEIPYLGDISEIESIIKLNSIEDVIICVEEEEHHLIPQLVDTVQNSGCKLKLIPDSYGMIMGMVKMNNILGAILVEVDYEPMFQWQKTSKRLFDIVFSMFALLCLSPVFAILSILIKLDSKGPIFFLQKRIGFKGKTFNIIKFRSMHINAESAGPQLSKENDPRITKVGKILRKTRLDELPQFYNVLVGEMSIVGPRPEREFFIDQIVKKAPIYKRLHRIKPGITSWGQVKYGYAENVDQMVARMKYDILYLENMSLSLDLKILLYTVLIMVQGRGK